MQAVLTFLNLVEVIAVNLAQTPLDIQFVFEKAIRSF